MGNMEDAQKAVQHAGVNAKSAGLTPASETPPLSPTEMLNALSLAQSTGSPRPKDVPDSVRLPFTGESIKNLMVSDADIQKALNSGSLSEMGKGKDPAEKRILEDYGRAAQDMGINPIPKLYVDHGALPIWRQGDDQVPLALSTLSKEGSPAIIVTPAFIEGFNPREQTAVLKSEMAQFKNGDMNPEVQAQMINDPPEAMQRKYKADKDAGDPAGLASALTTYYTAEVHANPDITPENFKAQFDKITTATTPRMFAHPLIEERLENLGYQMQWNVPDARPKKDSGQSR